MELDAEPAPCTHQFGQPLERWLKAEVVQGGWAQLRCQPSNIVEGRADELADQSDRFFADLPLDRLQSEQDRGERLTGLVVELAGESCALDLLSIEQCAHGLSPDPLGELDRDGHPVREGLRDPHVGIGEARIRAFLVIGDDNAD